LSKAKQNFGEEVLDLKLQHCHRQFPLFPITILLPVISYGASCQLPVTPTQLKTWSPNFRGVLLN